MGNISYSMQIRIVRVIETYETGAGVKILFEQDYNNVDQRKTRIFASNPLPCRQISIKYGPEWSDGDMPENKHRQMECV